MTFTIEPCDDFIRVESLLVPTKDDLKFLPLDGQACFVWMNEESAHLGSHDDEIVDLRIKRFQPALYHIQAAISNFTKSESWFLFLGLDTFDFLEFLPRIDADLFSDIRLSTDISGIQFLKAKLMMQPYTLPLRIHLIGNQNLYLMVQGFAESYPLRNGLISGDFSVPDTCLFHRAYYFLEKNHVIVGYPDYSLQLAYRSGAFGFLIWAKESQINLEEFLNRSMESLQG